QAELLAQAEDRLLRPLGALELVVARIAHRAEEHRIGLFGRVQRLRWKRVAVALVRRAADGSFAELNAEVQLVEDAARLRNDLRPDAVTGQHGDVHLRSTRGAALCAAPRRPRSCPSGAASGRFRPAR